MKFTKGLNRDNLPIDQPAGTWRYARNIVIPNNSTDLQSEAGNETIVQITGGYRVVGTIVLQDEKVVIFSVATAGSEIGVFDPILGTYTALVNDQTNTASNKFNFSRSFPIQGEYKIDATGQVSVYWTDDRNPMRFLRLYDLPTMGPAFDLETLNIFPKIKEAPVPELDELINGNLTVGAYALTVAMVTADGTSTNYMNISNWVYITDKSEQQSYANHMQHDTSPAGGDTNVPLTKHTATSWSGSEPAIGSGAGIKFRVTNLDDRYTILRPAIVKMNNGVVTTCVLPDRDFDASGVISVSYTGNESCQAAPSLAELLIPQESYDRAKTVAQVDDVLYWGNLQKGLLDIGYQKFANSIEVHKVELNDTFATERVFVDKTKSPSETKTINLNLKTGGVNRRSEDVHFYRGYQRDETYAIYISWILKDGNETVAYHIPGREAIDISDFCGNAASGDPIMENNYLNDVVDPNYDIPALHEPNLGNPMLGKLNTYGATISPTGMGYWENEGELYPIIDPNSFPNTADSYEVWTVTAGVATPVIDPATNTTKTLAGSNVRHHHFPSDAYQEGAGKIFNRASWMTSNPMYHQPNNRMNPMGFKLVNIPITQEVIDNCLAYKIYYSKRTEGNTTVMDCGLFNLMPSYHGPHNGGWGADTGSTSTGKQACPANYPGPVVTGQHNPRGDWNGLASTAPAYVVQDPPEDDGEIVCFPHSSCAAPESDVMHVNQRMATAIHEYDIYYRGDWTAKGKNFTFNGLHSHINSPDVSDITHIKLTRHLTIGRLEDWESHSTTSGCSSTGQLRGFSFFRHDDQNNSYAAGNVHRTFIDWTIMNPLEYDDKQSINTAECINNQVEAVTSASGPTLYKNILSLGAAKYMAADELSSVTHDGGHTPVINNVGGDQTLYLSTHNHVSAHDFGCLMNLYYTFTVVRLISICNGGSGTEACGSHYDCSGTTNDRDVNWVAWAGGKYTGTGAQNLYTTSNDEYGASHNWMINWSEDDGYSCGTWAHRSYSIGRFQVLADRMRNKGFNANEFPDPYSRSNQDIWTSRVHNTFWHFETAYTHYTGDWDCDNDVNECQWRVRQAHAYGSIHRLKQDVYSPVDVQSLLVFTGHTMPITKFGTTPTIINPYTVVNTYERTAIMGGDVYIDLYCETRAMKQNGNRYPGGAPSSNIFANSTLSNPVDGHFSDRSTHYTYGIYGDFATTDGTITDIGHQLYVTESKINISMRHTLNNDYEDYYPLVNRDAASINTHFDLPRLYSYNQDYSQLMTLYPTVVFNFQNQLSSTTDYPTRIIRSVEYNQRGLADNFRTYLPAQYRDLPRNRGEIWNLAVYDNLLLPQTERSLWKTKGKEALNLADVSQVALGSGDLFEKEPDELLYTNRGYAGTVSQFASLVTRHGLFTVDKQAGKVFLLGENLEEISNYGLREFFKLRLNSTDLVPFGAPYNLDIPSRGLGIIAGYDPQFDRILLTKRNLVPTAYFETEYSNGNIQYRPQHRQFYHAGNVNAYINWSNQGYFTREHWTISYYPSLKLWCSLHDYYPTNYFYTSNNIYSINSFAGGTDQIFEHNFSSTTSPYYNIANFYGTDNDVIFEYIDNIQPSDVKTYLSIFWDATVTLPSSNEAGAREDLHSPGFTHAQVYNTNQVSQEINFVEPGGPNNNLFNSNIRFIERNWITNHFRDDRDLDTITQGTTITHLENAILLADVSNARFDINPNAIDPNKQWNTRRKIRDKWLAIRLIQKGTNSIGNFGKNLLTLHSADANKRKSYR